MFNLLQGIECVEGRHTLLRSRIYNDNCSNLVSVEDYEKRANLPTVVINESGPLSEEMANFARLSEFSITPNEVEFHLQPSTMAQSFPAALLDQYKFKHALSDAWNWHHTCWQFGQGNIYETLFREARTSIAENRPKIFTLKSPTKTNPKLVACMMPFKPQFDDIYESIRSACSAEDLNSLRVDEIYGTKPIIDDVIDAIDDARFVICDLTGRNPNVLYETGISHTLGREVIVIAQDIESDVPFDLKHLRCIEYDGTNQTGRDQLADKLVRTFQTLGRD